MFAYWKTLQWPIIIWVALDVVYDIFGEVWPAFSSTTESYAFLLTTLLGILLAFWTGTAVKAAAGTMMNALESGCIVGLAGGIPVLVLEGGLGGHLESAGVITLHLVLLSIFVALIGYGWTRQS
ncbi:MAG: hypothetical protein HY297_05040 [Thaumarchaeota archaeon]|nr:hypothetical protein [Nitrososphaerota archaeon]